MTRASTRRAMLRACGGGTALLVSGCITDSPDGHTQNESSSRTTTVSDGHSPAKSTDTDIPRYKYDLGRTGGRATEPPPEDASVAWSVKPEVQNGLFIHWPLRLGDTLYFGIATFGHFPGAILALDARTGDERWRQDLTANATPLASSTETIVAGVDSYEKGRPNKFVALDASTGEYKWEKTYEPTSVTAPVIVGEQVLTTIDGTITAFDIADGTIRWTAGDTASYFAPIAIRNDTAFTVQNWPDEERSQVIAFDVSSGDRRWGQETTTVQTAPAVTDGVLYTGDRENTIRARSTDDGTERWSHSVGELESDPPQLTLGHGHVYVGTATDTENVFAVDQDTGERQWSSTALGLPAPLPALREHVAVPRDGGVAMIDPSDGRRAYELAVEGKVLGCAIAGGEMFLDTRTPGTLHVACIR